MLILPRKLQGWCPRCAQCPRWKVCLSSGTRRKAVRGGGNTAAPATLPRVPTLLSIPQARHAGRSAPGRGRRDSGGRDAWQSRSPRCWAGRGFCRDWSFPFVVNLCNLIRSKLSQRPNSCCAGGPSRVNREQGNAAPVIANSASCGVWLSFQVGMLKAWTLHPGATPCPINKPSFYISYQVIFQS